MRNIFGAVVCFVLSAVYALAQTAAPGMDLSNDKLTLTVAAMGGKFTKLVMREGDGTSPIHTIGHFLALDGFGAASEEEQALGMPFHGEANRREMKVVASNTSGPVRVLTLQSTLPLAQETLTRTMQLVDGENIVYVTSQLESALAIDRPISWAEHATIGPPFLERENGGGYAGRELPRASLQARPHSRAPGVRARLPMAHGAQHRRRARRPARHSTDKNALDLASCQMDPRSAGWPLSPRSTWRSASSSDTSSAAKNIRG